MGESNGNGERVVNFKWLANILVGVVVAAAGTILGWQLKSAMPRSEITLLVQSINQKHEAIDRRDDAQDDHIIILQTSIVEMTKTLAVMEYKIDEMYKRSANR